MSVLKEFIRRSLNEAKKDLDYLRDLNLRQLKKAQGSLSPGAKPGDVHGPKEDPRSFYTRLSTKASSGPIFSDETLSHINDVPDGSLSRANRKTFVKWLATQIESGELSSPIRHNDVSAVRDWFDATSPDIDDFNWKSANDAQRDWHQTFTAADPGLGDYETKDVVYELPKGWTIVRVPPEDLDHEGNVMGHCVGGYCAGVESGQTQIFSLRDPKNAPHVTMSFTSDDIVQEIKGKQNAAPKEKYSLMVREWFDATDLMEKNLAKLREDRNAVGSDFVNILPTDQITELQKEGLVSMWQVPPTDDNINAFLDNKPDFPDDDDRMLNWYGAFQELLDPGFDGTLDITDDTFLRLMSIKYRGGPWGDVQYLLARFAASDEHVRYLLEHGTDQALRGIMERRDRKEYTERLLDEYFKGERVDMGFAEDLVWFFIYHDTYANYEPPAHAGEHGNEWAERLKDYYVNHKAKEILDNFAPKNDAERQRLDNLRAKIGDPW